MLADAGHNLSDVAGLLVAWGGLKAVELAPDARHTYGWKRASILAAFINAVLLLLAMGALGWEAVQRLGQDSVPDGWTIIWVAGIGVVINTATALLFLRGQEDLNIRGAFLHMAADALVSVGVVVSGILALVFAWGWLDPLLSLIIAAIIVIGTWGLFRQSLHLLFDGVPAGIALDEVQAYFTALPGVEQVHDLHVWALGTSETALTVHLLIPGGVQDDTLLARIAEDLQTRFNISHPTVQIEHAPRSCGCAQGFIASDDPA
ncbi:MAG: cation diffusion facilitator family transporter [Thiolinea sp.]